MKYKLALSGQFKRSVKIAKKRGLDISLMDSIVDKLLNKIPLEPKYKDHALQGNWKGFRECHIQPDWLVLFTKDWKYGSVIDEGGNKRILQSQKAYAKIPVCKGE
ncbi:MAG: type II toxin-antitoxin system YafQ family toxin [Lachnospiraceae bacterium]|nr:type II toxin-antitoxin system YafQ family toxin [Lachnospiraceae bacterium]